MSKTATIALPSSHSLFERVIAALSLFLDRLARNAARTGEPDYSGL